MLPTKRIKKTASIVPTTTSRRHVMLALSGLALAAALAYSNTFNVPFVFDDRHRIEENPDIRQLWPISVSMTDSNRPIGMLSFAVNYALHGYQVWGYHATNLAIHILAGLTLFGIVRRTLSLKQFAGQFQSSADALAFTIALVWLVHPLNTQAVTYIIQRLESLMGLCYLSTLYCFIRAQDSPRRALWLAASVACCALGMAIKEVMVTAPVMVIWYHRAFLADSWRDVFRSHAPYYACLFSTWGILVWCILRSQEEYSSGNIAFVKGMTPVSYLLTQAGVISHYLRLSVWPIGLCLDYKWPIARTAREILPPLLLIGGLFLGTLWVTLRRPHWGFLGGWFFCTLAPTSSFVPIDDLAFEHRMYLALAAVVVVVVLLAKSALDWFARLYPQWKRRLPFVRYSLVAIGVVSLTSLTWARNDVYRTKIGLWEDTVRKAPYNHRAHGNLAAVLRMYGRLDESFEHSQQAIQLAPESADANSDYGVALMDRGEFEASLRYYQKAIDLVPTHHQAHANLATSLWKLGRRDESLRRFAFAQSLAPWSGEIRSDFAKALAGNKATDQALKSYEAARQTNPHDPEIHYNTGVVLQNAGQLGEAARYYREAIRLDSTHFRAHNNLGITLMESGRIDEAIAHFFKAVELAPQSAVAEQNLGLAYADAGQVAKAIEHLKKALEIQPDLRPAADRLKRLREHE